MRPATGAQEPGWRFGQAAPAHGALNKAAKQRPRTGLLVRLSLIYYNPPVEDRMEVDLHGRNLYQARQMLMSALARTTGADYRLRVIHGYRGGRAIRDMLLDEFSGHPKVLRIERSHNPGETILVLREYY